MNMWLNYFELGRGSKIINCVFAVYATSKLAMAGVHESHE